MFRVVAAAVLSVPWVGLDLLNRTK